MSQLIQPVATIAILGLATVLVSRIPYSEQWTKDVFDRFAILFQGLVFLQISWIALRVFNHISMTSDFPWTDRLLISWDKRLGFDWDAYFTFVRSHWLVEQIMAPSYTSLTDVSLLAFLFLVFVGDPRRARFFWRYF
jgi:hypothetical protein